MQSIEQLFSSPHEKWHENELSSAQTHKQLREKSQSGCGRANNLKCSELKVLAQKSGIFSLPRARWKHGVDSQNAIVGEQMKMVDKWGRSEHVYIYGLPLHFTWQCLWTMCVCSFSVGPLVHIWRLRARRVWKNCCGFPRVHWSFGKQCKCTQLLCFLVCICCKTLSSSQRHWLDCAATKKCWFLVEINSHTDICRF